MKLQSLLSATALIGLAAFSSCNKVDSVTGGGSGNLDAGKGTISFNTSRNFGGSTSYDGTNTMFNSAMVSSGAGTFNQITITTTAFDGASAKTAQFIIEIDKSLNTNSGNLNADFANQSSDRIIPILAISNTSSTTDAYGSESGAVVITKLTATEVEGTFSGHFVNDDQHTSIEISNGHFAGKFK